MVLSKKKGRRLLYTLSKLEMLGLLKFTLFNYTSYVCLCVCLYVYMYVCMYVYIYIYIYIHTHTHTHTHIYIFLRSNYTDITQNTYIQSLMVTETLNIEKWGLVWCLRTVLCPWRHTSRIRSCIPTLSLDAAQCNLGYNQMLAVYSG